MLRIASELRMRLAISVLVCLSLLFVGSHPAAAVVDTSSASISGKITAPAGVTLTALAVLVMTSSNGYAGTGFVNADGTYTVSSLQAGSYKLSIGDISGQDSGTLPQWYNNATTFETATPVTVTVGQAVTGINFTLKKDSRISGKVTAPPGVNLTKVFVYSYASASGAYVGFSFVGADGTYKITGLVAGSYKLEFGGTDTNAVPQWYSNASSSATATPVVLTAGQAVTGINVTLKKAASISGKITAPSGVDLTLLSVSAQPTAGSDNFTGFASVGSDGTYKVSGLAPGSYKLDFDGGATSALTQWYKDAASFETAAPVTVTEGQALAGINVTLKKAASISGKITVPPGVDLTDMYVSTVQLSTDTNPGGLGLGFVQADGTYTITQLTAGSYRLCLFRGILRIFLQCYTNAASYEAATLVNLTSGQDLTGINIALAPALGPAPAPTITGTAKVGSTLTAVPGTWGPAPVALTYQWKANGVSITGATAATFKPGAAQVGKTLTVTVTGAKTGYTTAAKTSAAAAAVVAGALGPAPVPTITGTAKVGSTLTAVPGTWGPAPVALTYQWKANGVSITGATAATFKPGAAQVGKTITVTVTGAKTGYTTAAKTSAAAAAVVAGTLGPAPVPTITGTAKVGSTLTAAPGTWGPAPVALAYQWKANGAAITGATAATYKPAAAQVGKTITVTVTGTKAGYTTMSKTSTATVAVAPGTLGPAPVPTITGTVKVGSTLTAAPGTWGPAPVALAYQWKANGAAITGATAATYKLTTAQAGKTITVTVTGTKTGYTTKSKTSAATARVV
ncbi:hypothetical protein SRABI26_00332 [Arthrobacter sp. Bi26]|uniref:carboxypeptidase regulatory-like domain-containing protein n=1 Tax=Arthrobacter sp. Bi26 TaxID=2822350 RepID=UPI001D25849C|nr:carboxypeptidase regulatory-like domain-containing protein [Arthrobacter sp. Bi26]CAH0135421.1 hypothetical protein SRABI26_00332 [Arthrobacter sp. Bi26]